MDDSTNAPKRPSVTDRLISRIRALSEEEQERLLKALEKLALRDRRAHPRELVLEFVDLTSEGRTYREVAQDMSEGGVYIATSTPFSKGKEVVVTFTSPSSLTNLKVTGSVARVDDRGVGIEFKVDTPFDKDSLRSLLRDFELLHAAP